jgi:hypothetical protein
MTEYLPLEAIVLLGAISEPDAAIRQRPYLGMGTRSANREAGRALDYGCGTTPSRTFRHDLNSNCLCWAEANHLRPPTRIIGAFLCQPEHR